MAKKIVTVPDVGRIYIAKNRGQKVMRLRVDNKGLIQVSMPKLMPQQAAIAFAKSKLEWIRHQQSEVSFMPYDGMLLGKRLKLVLRENASVKRTILTHKEIQVNFESKFDASDELHIEKVQKAIIRALRVEAESFLLPRLRSIAYEYSYSYRSASIKLVHARWGSCDSNSHIALSVYLAQLPIELIDYVLIHELVHTRHMNHSRAFWAEVERLCPEYLILRKKMRGLRPKIYDAKTFM